MLADAQLVSVLDLAANLLNGSPIKSGMTVWLERNGIGALPTKPETLMVDAINKYLEIKAWGMI